MGTAVLRPNGTVSSTGWTIIGGSATHHAAHSDNSDATYSQKTAGQELLRTNFDNISLPFNAQIRSVTFRIRMNGASPTDEIKIIQYDDFGANRVIVDGLAHTNINTLTTLPYATSADGLPWDAQFVNAIELSYERKSGTIRVYEAYIDVLYNEEPVATVTAPTEGSSVTDTTRPTITWTYADPEADAQERYIVKIFSAAQYGDPGFNPSTSTPTWTSGEVLSTATSKVVPIDLVNGTTYRAYVRVADAGSNGRYSLWDNNTFTINVTPPPAPALVLTPQVANADGPRTKLDITRTSDVTPTTYMVIEYSDDAGAIWKILRGASKIVNSPDGTTFTFYDYEAIPGVARSYRAKAVRTV